MKTVWAARSPDSPRKAPYFLEHFVQVRVVFLELCTHEGIKIVPVKESFRSLGDVFLVISEAVVPARLACVEEDLLIKARILSALKSLQNLEMLKAQNLVVVRMCKFVQYHGRMFEHLFA
jgi:hypothetical protein